MQSVPTWLCLASKILRIFYIQISTVIWKLSKLSNKFYVEHLWTSDACTFLVFRCMHVKGQLMKLLIVLNEIPSSHLYMVTSTTVPLSPALAVKLKVEIMSSSCTTHIWANTCEVGLQVKVSTLYSVDITASEHPPSWIWCCKSH